jgi:tRNA(Ile)-lysidine synthase
MMPLCGDFFMLILGDKILADAQGLFEGVERVLLAVSGGADSVAMAHVLAKLKKQGQLSCDFVVGHVNHCLRGAESEGDEDFVQQFAQALGMPVAAVSISVTEYAKERKLSIETAGRILRLKTLATMAAEHDCDCIATAHHKDDLAETMVHRLMRGTGYRGLCGILSVSEVYGGRFVRPMLAVRRVEIIHHCRDNSIHWRQDASNANVDFTRNRIRHTLMPVLEAEFENLVDRLADLSQAARRFSAQSEKHAHDILDTAIVEHQPSRIVLQKACLGNCPPWVFYDVVRNALILLDIGLRNYAQKHFKAIYALMDQEKANLSMPGPVQVYTQKGVLGFQNETNALCLPSGSVILEVGQSARFGPWQVSCQLFNCEGVDVERFWETKDRFVEWFDADKIEGSIEIRARQDGDRFRPIGAKGEKKAGRFLIDAQLDANMKCQAFIVADAEKILWVAPVRMCEQAKITSETQHIVEIRLSGLG